MSYTYANKKPAEQAPRTESEVQGLEQSALLSGGTAPTPPTAPTPEQMGHRVDLPDVMREKMESAFGADLSAVRLYESRAVAEAGAEALTRGSDIAFAPGMLDFTSYGGQALLGHEISHVVSQARGEVTGSGFLNDHALEARADREGAMAAAGQQIAMPAAAMSTVSAADAAGPMQAHKGKEEIPDVDERDVFGPMPQYQAPTEIDKSQNLIAQANALTPEYTAELHHAMKKKDPLAQQKAFLQVQEQNRLKLLGMRRLLEEKVKGMGHMTPLEKQYMLMQDPQYQEYSNVKGLVQKGFDYDFGDMALNDPMNQSYMQARDMSNVEPLPDDDSQSAPPPAQPAPQAAPQQPAKKKSWWQRRKEEKAAKAKSQSNVVVVLPENPEAQNQSELEYWKEQRAEAAKKGDAFGVERSSISLQRAARMRMLVLQEQLKNKHMGSYVGSAEDKRRQLESMPEYQEYRSLQQQLVDANFTDKQNNEDKDPMAKVQQESAMMTFWMQQQMMGGMGMGMGMMGGPMMGGMDMTGGGMPPAAGDMAGGEVVPPEMAQALSDGDVMEKTFADFSPVPKALPDPEELPTAVAEAETTQPVEEGILQEPKTRKRSNSI